MSKVLETVKVEVARARNQALIGKYNESITGFGEAIAKLTS